MAEEVIWIDTDCGFDDLGAISLLDEYSRRFPNKMEIGFISTVNGMANPVMAKEILGKLFQSDGFYSKPIISCGYDSIKTQKHYLKESDWGPQYKEDFSGFIKDNLDIYGDDFSSKLEQLSDRIADFEEIVNGITNMSKTKEQRVTLLCLGPLTNIAQIIKQYPTLLAKHVDRVVLMGGAVLVNGNAPGEAEYNFYLDPVSAAFALNNCPVRIEMLGLEVANDKCLQTDEYNELISSLAIEEGISKSADHGGKEALELLSSKMFLQTLSKKTKDSLSYDTVAAYYLMNPTEFTFDPIKMEINDSSGRTTKKVSNANESGRELSDGIDVNLSVNFSRSLYFNYLLSKVFKNY